MRSWILGSNNNRGFDVSHRDSMRHVSQETGHGDHWIQYLKIRIGPMTRESTDPSY